MFKSILNTLNGQQARAEKEPPRLSEVVHQPVVSEKVREVMAAAQGRARQVADAGPNKQRRLLGRKGRKRLSAMVDRLQSSIQLGARASMRQSKFENSSHLASEQRQQVGSHGLPQREGGNLNYATNDDNNNNNNNYGDDDEHENNDHEDDDDDDANYETAEEVCRKLSFGSCNDEADVRRLKSSSKIKQSDIHHREPDPGDDKIVLPEELCDIPTFLHTKNCDRELINETRRLLKERYAKNPDSFYDDDYRRMLTDDWTVSRFLLRRRNDPKRTAKLMEECGRFRKQYKMSEVQLWEFPIEFHKAGGLFKYAPDRVGNLTCYMRVKMYRRVPEISDVFKAFILCVLEQCDVANNGRGLAVIFDLSGCGLQNVDLSFLSWLLSSFRNYCPKGVSYILVYNLPWILNATCKLAMTWMSASNRRALRFVYGNEIENFIARENLPDYLGGSCKINYRAIPENSKPAIEVCERLDMTREQALKIRELFKEYLVDEEGSRSHYVDAKSSSEVLDEGSSTTAAAATTTTTTTTTSSPSANRNEQRSPMADLVSQASKFIAH